MRLRTLGGVALHRQGGEAVKDECRLPRRGLALLALLAAEPSTGVSRDSVVAYLWPESDQEKARNALRQTLFTLRRVLERPDLILGGPELLLNPAALTSDIRDLQLARAAGDLEGIVALYGGPFLEGFHIHGAPEFERWVDRRRDEYASWSMAALESLGRSAVRRGDHLGAAEYWRQLVASDPLNTRFVLELMRAQATVGNVAGALRHAQLHEELLQRELRVSPEPLLRDFVASLRAGQPVTTREARQFQTLPSQPSSSPEPAPERFQDRLSHELAERYSIEADEIGAGHGVWLLRAYDHRHDRNVTLKVMHPALASQIDGERFVREIRITGKLMHPHILPLLDSGEVAGRPWFAVPRPEGETLRVRLSRDGALKVNEAVGLTLELADALAYAHGHAVIHRDVSPENVLLAGGHALLTNLGVARALDTAGARSLTDTGMLVGSAAYMSPEQAQGAHSVDPRTDIYAMGAVLFEMLRGEPLFSGPTPQAIMAKRAGEPAPDARRLAGLPPGIRRVLTKALTREANRRYNSMSEFSSALSGSLSELPHTTRAWTKLMGWLKPNRI